MHFKSPKKKLDLMNNSIMSVLVSLQARLASLRQLQYATGEELRRRRTLMPSILDNLFKGDL